MLRNQATWHWIRSWKQISPGITKFDFIQQEKYFLKYVVVNNIHN